MRRANGAKDFTKKVQRVHPKFRDLERSAVAAFDGGKTKLAAKRFGELLRDQPANISGNFYLALIELKAGRAKNALKFARKVIKINPREFNAHLNLGCIYEELGRNDMAVRCFRRELKQKPGCWSALAGLGLIYFSRRKYKLAAHFLESPFKANPERFNVRQQLSTAFQKTRQLEKEIALYKGCLDRNPNDPWSLQNLGAAMLDAGKLMWAEFYLKRAKKFLPDDRSIDRNMERVHRAKLKASTR